MLIKIENKVDEISRLCDEVKKFCNDNQISDSKYHDIVLILDEMVTNVISYAYPDGGVHTFTLDIHRGDDQRIYIKLVDDGIPFDPLAQDESDIDSSLEKRQIGGLGIFIVKHLAEAVEYSRLDDKNNLDIVVSMICKNPDEEKAGE